MDLPSGDSYKYSIKYAFQAHDSDVRVIKAANFSDSGIITGSRDSLVKVWTSDGDNSYKKECTLVGATNFVASLCILPSSSEYPEGLILAGSNDSKIYGFTLNSAEPVMRLFGHSSTVCSLSAGKFGVFVSGSWDKTARLWTGQQCTNILEGHDQAVWATKVLPCQNIVLTGSADHTIRIWHSGICQKVLYGHEDCVRGLAVMSDMSFLSCSNDGSVRMWNLNGEFLHMFSCSTNYIYSITVFNNGVDFATCGEDQTVRIFEKGTCMQSILIPNKTLWSVSCMKNGDLAVGCSDGSVYIIGKTPSNFVDYIFVEEKRSNSPLPLVDGKATDEVPAELFNKDPQLDNGGDRVNDKEIEFLVELKGQFFKVCYTKGDDPWDVAQKFVEEHSLAISYTSEIADYIFKLAALEPSTVRNEFFPVKEYVMYTTVNVAGLKSKLIEFSSLVPKQMFVNSTDIEQLSLLTEQPEEVTNEQLQALDIILTWSDEYLFPALDLLRLAVRCKVIRQKVVGGQTFVNHLLHIIRSTARSVNRVLVIKTFCNMFDSEDGQEVLLNNQTKICTSVKEVLSSDKNIQKACASLFMNYAIAAHHGVLIDVEQYCRDISEILYSLVDSQAVFRTLVGIGTVCISINSAVTCFQSLNVRQFLLKCKDDTEVPVQVSLLVLLLDLLK